jgi:hypothetical protein
VPRRGPGSRAAAVPSASAAGVAADSRRRPARQRTCRPAVQPMLMDGWHPRVLPVPGGLGGPLDDLEGSRLQAESGPRVYVRLRGEVAAPETDTWANRCCETEPAASSRSPRSSCSRQSVMPWRARESIKLPPLAYQPDRPKSCSNEPPTHRAHHIGGIGGPRALPARARAGAPHPMLIGRVIQAQSHSRRWKTRYRPPDKRTMAVSRLRSSGGSRRRRRSAAPGSPRRPSRRPGRTAATSECWPHSGSGAATGP